MLTKLPFYPSQLRPGKQALAIPSPGKIQFALPGVRRLLAVLAGRNGLQLRVTQLDRNLVCGDSLGAGMATGSLQIS